MEKTIQLLEFYKIIDKLKAYSNTEYAKEKFQKLTPYFSEVKVISELNETTETTKILDKIGNPPIIHMKEVEKFLKLANIGRYVNSK